MKIKGISIVLSVILVLGLILFAFNHSYVLPNKKTDWRKQFPEFVSDNWEVEECNGLIAVSRAMAVDFGMQFIRVSDKKRVGKCSFWLSMETQSPCKPPKGWTCDFPKNYRG